MKGMEGSEQQGSLNFPPKSLEDYTSEEIKNYKRLISEAHINRQKLPPELQRLEILLNSQPYDKH